MWKITIFSQPCGGQKKHFFAHFVFLWIWILITGRCIWGGLFEFFENLLWKKRYIFQHNDILGNFRIQTFLNFEFFVLNHSYGYLGVYFMAPKVHWQNAKKWEWFFSGGVMCEKLPFFFSPAVVRKGTFLHNFFFSEYQFWSQVGASGVVYLSFLRMYDEKIKKFQHNDILRNFRIQTFLNFEFFVLNHSYGYFGVYFMAPRVHWQNAKKWEWFFSGGVMCEKLPFFLSPAVVRKDTFLHNFFFSSYRFVITGWCIWGSLFEFFENLWWKNDKFFSTMTY